MVSSPKFASLLSHLSLSLLLLNPLLVSAQTYQRLGACPTLGCVFPPDQTDFLVGQLFYIRLEVHAPVNGTEATSNTTPDETFTLCIQKGKGNCVDAKKYFSLKSEPAVEKWNFT